ncbi:hypothetical protein HK098_003724 [Nowakowskiella sp. JEL0407]|nr:hypothetical protein HK098_003724 [Nowakowskiella sp. JEL0407]
MSFPRFETSSEQELNLKNAVKKKLNDLYQVEDPELVEYVVVLLSSGKSKDLVTADLGDILGTENDPNAFVNWLYDSGASLFKPSMAAVKNGEQQTTESPTQKRKSNEEVDAPKTERPSKFPKIVWDLAEEKTNKPKIATPDDRKNRFGTSLNKTDTRSNSQSLSTSQLRQNNQRPNGYNQMPNQFKQQQFNNQPFNMNQRYNPHFMNNGMMPQYGYGMSNMGMNGSQSLNGGSKEQCRFWPNCLKQFSGECEYFHPPAPINPAMQMQMMMQQQKVECKFGAQCTRADCKFGHPSPAAAAAKSMSMVAKAKIRCRFWPNCINPSCPFLHPSENVPGSDHSEETKKLLGSIDCKYEPFCTRPNCPYKHGDKKHPSERKFAEEGNVEFVAAEKAENGDLESVLAESQTEITA